MSRHFHISALLIYLLTNPGAGYAELPFQDMRADAPPRVMSLRLSTTAAVGMLGVGLLISGLLDETKRPPVFGTPPGIDRYFRDHLHQSGKTTNFLNERGTVYTMVGGVAAMVILEHRMNPATSWPGMARELTIYGTGLVTELGFRLSVKSLVARQRPLLRFADPTQRPALNAVADNHLSFYSGHTSSAFYTAAYVDQKMGDLINNRDSGKRRLLYRYAAFSSLYGWAGYTAYSRIQIDAHYFTDVLAGAIIGTSWGIWHYKQYHNRPGSWSVMPVIDNHMYGMVIRHQY